MDMKIQDRIETRLLEWARWSRRAVMPRLGYPSQSTIAKMMYGDTAFGKNVSFLPLREDDNPRAEEMDRLLTKLSRYDKVSAEVVKIQYMRHASQKVKAEKIGISVSQYKMRLNLGKAWLSGCLATSIFS